MSINTFRKQTSEIIPISMNYTPLLNGIETISSLLVVIYDKDNLDVTTDILSNQSINGSICKIVVKNGLNRTIYKITFKITTNEGNIYEEDVVMNVCDV